MGGVSTRIERRYRDVVPDRCRGPASALAVARLALAVVLGARLALSPFTAAVGQPDALWHPRGIGHVFASPPPVALVLALQVAGAAGAALYVWRRRLPPLVGAWVCLLLLAGLRTSLGKVLHNDVLLLLAAAPLVLAGPVPSEEPTPRKRRRGSSEELTPSFPTPPAPQRSPGPASGLSAPQRGRGAPVPVAADDDARTGLDGAAAIVLVAYFSAGWWKLLKSGPAWAFSDNLRWSLAAGRGGSRWPPLTDWLVAHPVACVGLACGILAIEVGAPLLWLRPRLAPAFVAAAALMHAGTWVVLGLDYWAHLATVALVLLAWARMRRR